MPERTDHQPPPEGAHRVLPGPSYAAQMLLVTARILEMTPLLPLFAPVLDEALRIAAAAILHRVPAVVEQDALRLATAALPPVHPGETCGEHAIRLRTTAGWKPPEDEAVVAELHRLADADYAANASQRANTAHRTHDLVLHAAEGGAR
ncbi:hypothetical protein [Streptomyces sp. NPDC050738]|uniref:hypothetical protein n=1 Tax=Streptomyces sp. NPDC050738 TaxID=3154744 RepID=UPI003413A160